MTIYVVMFRAIDREAIYDRSVHSTMSDILFLLPCTCSTVTVSYSGTLIIELSLSTPASTLHDKSSTVAYIYDFSYKK